MTDIRKLSREIAEALLKEYAPGQPRTKSGRFDSTGGGGGGGVALDVRPPAPRIMRDITPGSPTIGKNLKVDFQELPKKSSDDLAKLRAEGGHSLTQHVGSDGKLSPERAKVHAELVSRQTMTHKEIAEAGVVRPDGKPTVMILGGGGGAGKSTLLSQIDSPDNPKMKAELRELGIVLPAAKLQHNEDGTTSRIADSAGVKRTAAVVNSDHAKAGIWSKDEVTRGASQITSGGTRSAAGRVHEESSVVSQRAFEVGLARGGDIIVDGTGDGGVAKRQAQFDGASRTHEVVGVFVTTRIGTSPTDGVRGDVASRGTKPIKLEDGGTVTRSIDDGLIVGAHRASNASFLQGISNPGSMFHRAVIYERTPILGKNGEHVVIGGRPQYKFTLAGHYDGTTFHELVPGIRTRIAARAGTNLKGEPRLNFDNSTDGLNEAITEADEKVPGASDVPYWLMLQIWVEVVNGVSIDDSTVLDDYPEAQDEWERVAKVVADAPEDVVMDIPAEISLRSIGLQDIYLTSPSEEPDYESVQEAAMTLAAHDNALYDAYERILAQHGKWAQEGVDSARYVNESPNLRKGIMCGACVFYIEEGGCELVEGTIRPEGGCKLNIPAPITEGTPGRRRALRALARAKVKNKLRVKAGKKPMIGGKEISVSKYVSKYGDPRKGNA